MRPWILLVLAACEPPEATQDVGDVDVTAHLEVSPHAYDERTKPLPGAVASLQPGGERLYGEPWSSSGHAAYTVVEALAEVAVMWENSGTRVVLWLERDDLAFHPVETSWFGGDGLGVRLPAGLPLDVVETREDAFRVAVGNAMIEVDTWAPRHAVDNWYYSGEDELTSPFVLFAEEHGDPVEVREGAELFGVPGGEAFATLVAEGGRHAWRTDRRGPWSRVRMMAERWPVDAWLWSDDATSVGLFGQGWGYGHSFGCGAYGRLPATVRSDAWLHDGPNGPIVGRTTRDLGVDLDGDPGGWRSYEKDTPFGTATLWVHPDDVL
ncbi:MAG: hypothetical protein H6736_14830 [Alphaproteobacteria bacterium]|nr:hypothetical protein [Alphaproteobacteria bacterium]MCB9693082.1 hypothetical protein [Alphaproteobacteria bacterium]